MLRLIARRSRVQLPLLAAVLAVVVIGATLLGVCALLLTTTQERAFEVAIARSDPQDVDVTAYLVGVQGKDADAAAGTAHSVLEAAFAPYRTSSVTRAAAVMRELGEQAGQPSRVAYLSAVNNLPALAELTSGRWPNPRAGASAAAGSAGPKSAAAVPVEAVVLDATARHLHLTPGSRVRLGDQVGLTAPGKPMTVQVVGTFRPLPGTGWDRDPLAAAGYDPAYWYGGSHAAQAYGPFVVALPDLFAGGSMIDRLQVTAHPDLARPTTGSLDRVAGALAGADRQLGARLGDRVQIERVGSDLPVTLAAAHAQQAVTRSAVLVVVLLGAVLTVAALGLAGRLVLTLRAGETALHSRLGAGRGQLVALSVLEAAGLAVLAAVLAVPLSSLAHVALTHLPPLAQAGLAAPGRATAAQVEAVLAGALLFAAVLVVPALRPDPVAGASAGTRVRIGVLARSGTDLLLLALALAAWWQLRAQPATVTPGTDLVRALAPVLGLLAGAALALRLVRLPLRAADRLARRSRGLLLPLAAFEAARRPQAIAAGLLLALAAAVGSFAPAFGVTWQRSQHDQAASRIGTDLALTLATAPTSGEGTAIAAATGGTVSPVTNRAVAIGQWVGDVDTTPRLVAIDTTHAAALLRGRPPPGRTWAQVGAALAPASGVRGLALPDSSAGAVVPILTGTSSRGPLLHVVPRLILQEPDGLRAPCESPSTPLDGRAHPLTLCAAPTRGLRIVAIGLELTLDPNQPGASSASGTSEVTVTIKVPTGDDAGGGTAPSGSGNWTAAAVGDAQRQLVNPRADLTGAAAADALLRTRVTVDLTSLPYEPAQLVATAFKAPAALPVAVSQRLADALSAPVGHRLDLSVAGTAVPVEVVEIVPTVPSAPGDVALLVDGDLLSRALIADGELEPPVDAWWAGRPKEPDARARATALTIGEVQTRAGLGATLSRGPLSIGLPAALVVLVPAVLLLLLAGLLMHVTSDVAARSVEVARLRGLGLPRRGILLALLAQHAGVLTLLLAAGAVVGAVVARVCGPLLIRSDTGTAPVPPALPSWPWPAETALLAGLLLGGMLVVGLVVAVQVRRADAAHLQAGS